MDMKGILRSAKKRDFVMYIAYLVEFSISKVIEDPKKYKRSPDAIVQTTVIFDLEGLSMQHITNRQGTLNAYTRIVLYIWIQNMYNFVNFTFIAVDVAIKLITLYEANYPEYLSNILVVNGKWWTIFVQGCFRS